MSGCGSQRACNLRVRGLYRELFRNLLRLSAVIVVLNILAANIAMADVFATQQTLSERFPDLRYWNETVVRIEVTKGSVVGTNGAPPTVDFKIIEVLRPGRFPPRESQKVTAKWIEDRAGGEQWDAARRLNRLDQWEALEIESPPAGTRLIAFVTIEAAASNVILAKDAVFADTPENKAIALSGARHQPFVKWASERAFYLIFVFALTSILALFISPLWATVFSTLSFLSFFFYNSHASELAIRLDLYMAYPTLVVAGLTAVIGVIRWLISVGSD